MKIMTNSTNIFELVSNEDGEFKLLDFTFVLLTSICQAESNCSSYQLATLLLPLNNAMLFVA